MQSTSLDEPKLSGIACYAGINDFTVYLDSLAPSQDVTNDVKKIESPEILDVRTEERRTAKRRYSYADTVFLSTGSEYRALICPCFRGRNYSVTLRKAPQIHGRPHGELVIKDYQFLTHQPWDDDTCPSQYQASGKPKDGYLFTFKEYTDVLFKTIFESAEEFEPQAGLIVVAGATSSGKSQIVRGIIHEYLRQLIRKRAPVENDKAAPEKKSAPQRRPHLVTFEDPVEVFYYDDPETAAKWGLDVTPRQKGIDAGSLSEALQDCLRQTPDLVYIGETRELRDWKRLVDFAGTGHLIVTTCHAGSLTEVVSTLCKAVDATTAARRSALASRLVAIAHLRRATVDIANKPGGDQAIFRKDAMLPALLRRTASGINAFTGNGLAALLPESACKDEVRRHCYGRSYFARKLVCMPDLKNRAKNQLENYQDRLTKLAIQYDLEGL